MDTHPVLAREGWAHVALSLAAALAATAYSPWLGAPFWVLLLFVAQFFRDPRRQPPAGEGLVVSPADGRVIRVVPAQDPAQDRKAVCVSVFMNVFNVHSNRAPEGGEVLSLEHRPGTFLNAAMDKASDLNEANTMVLGTKHGDITVVQVAGLVARRIICKAKVGDQLGRGQRYGFIRFGSRVDVYLDEGCEIHVAPGDRVRAGVDVMAVLGGQEGADV